MSTSKGGLVGLTYSDFNQRQKSGNWSIEDHAANVNYIRTSDIPNIYLSIGNYNTNQLDLYDVFFKTKISTNIFNIPQSTIRQIEFNYKKNLLAFVLTEEPYLKIYNTEDFTEYTLTKTFTKPINCIKINNKGDLLYIGFLEAVNKSYLNVYSIKDLTTVIDSSIITTGFNPISIKSSNIDIVVNRLITCIRFSYDDSYLYIGHYGTISNIYDNSKLFKRYNNSYVDITPNNLKEYNLLTPTDSLFIDDQKLLCISSFDEPYLNFYNYERQDLFKGFDSVIKRYITNKVNCLAMTKNKDQLIIGIAIDPYVLVLNLITKTIKPVINNYFTNDITSISFSVNDKYLCVTQRSETNPVLLFDYSKQAFDPVELEFVKESTPFASCFFLGPNTSYSEIEVPEYSVSSNGDALAAITSNLQLVSSGTFYNNSYGYTPDLAAHKNIFQTNIYYSIDNQTTYITSIKKDGTLITNDPNILNYKNHLINITDIQTYNSRILIKDYLNSIHILEQNNFSFDEQYYITKDFIKDIKQVSIGNNLVLGLKIDNTVVVSDPAIFNITQLNLLEVKQVAVGKNHFSILLYNSLVLTYFFNDVINIDMNTNNWLDTKKICSGDDFVLGLKLDNSLYLTGDIQEDFKNTILEEKNNLDIFTSPTEIILVKPNRTIIVYDIILNVIEEINI